MGPLAYDAVTPVCTNLPDPSTPFLPFPFNISQNSPFRFHLLGFQLQFRSSPVRKNTPVARILHQMASEAEVSSVSSLIERLMAMPFISAFTSAVPESHLGHGSEHQGNESTDRTHPGPSLDRIILINPVTQGMVVIGGSSTGFDSLLNDLMRKHGQPPASQASIDAMPTVEIKGNEDIESLGGECVICLEEWGAGDIAKEMPCKHKFHGGCVEKWLKIHGSCPVCRYNMPVDGSDKKNVDENGRMRREIWVTISFGNGRPSEEETPNQESVESNDSSSL